MLSYLKKSIILRVLFLLVAAVTLVSVVSIIYFNVSNSRLLRVYQQNSIANVTRFATLGYANPLWDLNQPGIASMHAAILQDPMVVAVNLYSIDAFHSGFKKDFVDGVAQFHKISHPSVIGKDPALKMVRGDITYEGMPIGHFEIIYSERFINAAIKAGTLRILLSFALMAAAIIGIVFVGFNQAAIKPIVSLAQLSRQVALSQDFSLQVPKAGDDEIGQLHAGFNTMLSQVHQREQERDRAEQELSQARNLLHNVINSMPSMLISVNVDGIITQWNEAAARITGIPAMQAIGKDLWEIAPRLQKYRGLQHEIVHEKRQKEFYRETFIEDDGKLYNITFFPLIANGAEGMVIRLDDITELEEKEEQLRQTQKMDSIGTLAGGLAHDFNNMLGGIAGSISILRTKLARKHIIKPEELDHFLGVMESAGMRASEMVDSLLALARKQSLRLAPVDLNQSVSQVMHICANTFDKSITLQPRYQKDAALIQGDPTQLEQVILNLCINAAHALTIMRAPGETPGGVLSIDLEKIKSDTHFLHTHPEAQPGHYWKLSVMDTGVGMDKKTAAKVFDPFFTTKEKGKGTGLGLAVVYNIIKQHHGFIDLYSEEGVGTTFNVYLPVLEQEATRTVREKKPEIPKGSGTILVVDDEHVMREVAEAILKENGYEVLLAQDGQEGVEVFQREFARIRAVVLDLAMPKKSGRETFHEMKAIDPAVRVLLASGFKQDERVDGLLKAGVQAFIEKPYTFEKLALAMAHLLGAVEPENTI